MQSPPSSVIFEFSGFSLHYYGIVMFFALLTAIAVICKITKKHYKDIDTEVILDILPPIILFSILGARMYYVLLDFSYYAKHIAEIPAVWLGGMSIHGGIIGGVLSGIFIALRRKISFLKYADVFSYGLAIGQAIGRFGNYFNCEAFGKPCSIPFIKLFIPYAHRPVGYEEFSYFHPTFLYESLWDLGLFCVLFFVIRKTVEKRNLPEGTIFFSYLLLYSIGRLFIEACRLDSVTTLWGFPVAQVVSVFIIIISAFALIVRKNKFPNTSP